MVCQFNDVLSARYSPDGSWIVLLNQEGKELRIVDVTEHHKCIQKISCDVTTGFTAQSFLLSPDNRYIVICLLDFTIKIWDTHLQQWCGEAFHFFFENHRYIIPIKFLPDSHSCVFCSRHSSSVYIVNIVSRKIEAKLLGSSMAVKNVSLSNDGMTLLFSGTDGIIKIWDIQKKMVIYSWRAHSAIINSIDFSPDGSKFITASADGTTKIWNSNTMNLLNVIDDRISVNILVAIFGDDGDEIFTLSEDEYWKIWDVNSCKLKRLERLNSNDLSKHRSQNNYFTIEGIFPEYSIEVYNSKNQKSLGKLIGHSGIITDINFSKNLQ